MNGRTRREISPWSMIASPRDHLLKTEGTTDFAADFAAFPGLSEDAAYAPAGSGILHQAEKLGLARIGHAGGDAHRKLLDVERWTPGRKAHGHDIILRHAEAFGDLAHRLDDGRVLQVDRFVATGRVLRDLIDVRQRDNDGRLAAMRATGKVRADR